MTVDELRQRLAADGLDYNEFASNLRDEVTVQRLRQRYVQSSVQVSEGEVDQMLASKDVGGDELRLANIQINVAEGATPGEIETAKKKIDEVKAMVERGEIDFRSAAIRYSGAQNALDGGDIGWRTMDAVPPVYVTMLKTMTRARSPSPCVGRAASRSCSWSKFASRRRKKSPSTRRRTSWSRLPTWFPPKWRARRSRPARPHRRWRGFRQGRDRSVRRRADARRRRRHGLVHGGSLGSAVGSQVQQLADGELSPVFQSDVGFHLIKRNGMREQDVTEENRRNQAREIIGQRKSEEAYERFLRQMRAEAYVDSRLAAPDRLMWPRLALVAGEPAGVGPELCVRLAQTPLDCEPVVIADPDCLQLAAGRSVSRFA